MLSATNGGSLVVEHDEELWQGHRDEGKRPGAVYRAFGLTEYVRGGDHLPRARALVYPLPVPATTRSPSIPGQTIVARSLCMSRRQQRVNPVRAPRADALLVQPGEFDRCHGHVRQGCEQTSRSVSVASAGTQSVV